MNKTVEKYLVNDSSLTTVKVDINIYTKIEGDNETSPKQSPHNVETIIVVRVYPNNTKELLNYENIL